MLRTRMVWPILVVTVILALGLAACGPAGTPTPEPTPTRPMRPTFTPTTVPTDTPVPTNTPVPTDTPTPIPTDTPTPAAPKAKIGGEGQVNVRSGPGTTYPEIGQVATGSELELIAKNAAGDWYQICCVDGEPAWVVARLVEVTGDANLVQVAANIPAPPAPTAVPTRPPAPRPTQAPAPTAPPAPTQPPAPAYQFTKVSADVRPNTNPIVTFYGVLFKEPFAPVTGFKMIAQAPSGETREFEFISPFQKAYAGLPSEFWWNAKVEFPFAEGVYKVWVADPGGNQVSESFELAVSGENRDFMPRWKQS